MSPAWEIELEPADGWSLATGEKWSGYRVRYRVGDVKRARWTSFLVVDCDLSLDALEARVAELVELHAQVRP